MELGKFRRALPHIAAMRVSLPGRLHPVFLTTAVHDDAPTLFKWHGPLAWYYRHNGVEAFEIGLAIGARSNVEVVGVTQFPGQDNPATRRLGGLIFLLKNARMRLTHGGLFPEVLHNDYHGIRAVVEAQQREVSLPAVMGAQQAIGHSITEDGAPTRTELGGVLFDGRSFTATVIGGGR
jgi:hypothetical protein